jgi:hypothetical protein
MCPADMVLKCCSFLFIFSGPCHRLFFLYPYGQPKKDSKAVLFFLVFTWDERDIHQLVCRGRKAWTDAIHKVVEIHT